MKNSKLLNSKLTLLSSVIMASLYGLSFNTLAEQADSKVISVTQADGSELNIRRWGDEFSHGWETEDGFSVIKNEKTGLWYFAQADNDGELVSSKTRVKKGESKRESSKLLRRGGKAKQRIDQRRKQAHNKNAFSRANIDGDDAVSGGYASSLSKTTISGTINVPIMLLNFADTNSSNSRNNFNDFLFSDSKGLTAYYDEVSYGKLTIQGGSSGVIDWVELPESHQFYGKNNSAGYDANIGVMIGDALDIADANVDFSQYADENNDCAVDLIAFVYQGNGEHQAVGASNDIWAHKYSMYYLESEGDGDGKYETNDACPSDNSKNMIINDYFVAPELSTAGGRANVGTFAHEFGHVFGLPDLYDTNGSTDGANAGGGDWTLMASGSKTGPTRDGESPAHISAWGKYMLGWIDPIKVNGTDLSDFELRESANNAEAILFENPSNENEYFIVENKNQRGFDAYTPGTGLLVWHIDDDIAAPGSNFQTQGNVNTVSCDLGYQDCSNYHNGVSVVSADYYYDMEHDYNDGDEHDTFGSDGDGGSSEYGSSKDLDTEFASNSEVNSNWWDNSTSDFSMSNISAKGNTMTLDLGEGGSGGGTTPPTGDDLVLENGSNETISASAGESVVASIEVPVDASNLVIDIVHNSGGDADLYVNYGSVSDSNSADCFLNTGSSTEVCDEGEFGATKAGTYFVTVKGYSGKSFDDVTLSASYDSDDGGTGGGTAETSYDVGVASGKYQHFEIQVPTGASSVTIDLDKNGGSAMLLVKQGSEASAREYDERDTSGNNITLNNPASGTWFIAIRGRNSGVSNGTLTVLIE
ncbi:M6 family metalloprotease domain-containing protein [Colwellia psychrerythraea]|uniref:M6 family metalloprotease domain protein n=1 Tax=Colwellia psychrerythraea TaxID=28229 RepID=A0A099K8F9_COLPS|nr:M6 family metalloprotease domain-containing protein [Colwellia psychrerythraea]KGJ86382.1 M6 family metalloprotease domain protein [Colwellia psychrerythraea]